MNYKVAMLLLVSCMSIRNHLLYFARFCAGSTPQNSKEKHTTKNFAKFPNHFPQLTVDLPGPTCIFFYATANFLTAPRIMKEQRNNIEIHGSCLWLVSVRIYNLIQKYLTKSNE